MAETQGLVDPLERQRAGTGKRTAVRTGLATAAALVATMTASIATLPAAAVAPHFAAGAARQGMYAGPAQQAEVVRPGTTLLSAQYTSRNWDGYITYISSEGSDFNTVKATWVQPTVTCPKPNAWTVFWVGLDGWWDDTVEQGGSSAQCVNGVPQYMTWWEMFPTNAITTAFAISAGDTITASVVYKTATANFIITVTDVTTGNSFTKHERCGNGLTCNRSSADLIAEDVGHFGAGSYFPLADYRTMTFTGAHIADIAGHSGTIQSKNWLNAAVTEQSSGVTYAKVSPLANNSFNAIWKHA
jgi:Peptidase A4 family